MALDPRWRQRFQNFDRAVLLLREPMERGIDTLSALEKPPFRGAFGTQWRSGRADERCRCSNRGYGQRPAS